MKGMGPSSNARGRVRGKLLAGMDAPGHKARGVIRSDERVGATCHPPRRGHTHTHALVRNAGIRSLTRE